MLDRDYPSMEAKHKSIQMGGEFVMREDCRSDRSSLC